MTIDTTTFALVIFNLTPCALMTFNCKVFGLMMLNLKTSVLATKCTTAFIAAKLKLTVFD